MKILHIASSSSNLGKPIGGVESATSNILSGFNNMDNLEVIFLPLNNKSFIQNTDNCFQNIEILNYKRKNILIIPTFIYNRYFVRRVIDNVRPNVIHFHGTGPNIYSLSNLQKDNIVITQHGINRLELKFQDSVLKKVKFLIKSIVERKYFPNFLNYIFISKSNLNITKKYYSIDLNNSKVIPNAVNSNFLKIKSKSTTSNKLLYVGHISRLKNLMLVLYAINELNKKNKQYELNIVGKIKDIRYYSNCVKFIENNKLNPLIHFKDHLTQNEIIDLYHDIDIFILPSLQENSPISILEAMAAGRVPIATNVGGIPEIITDGKTGYLLKKHSVEELIEVLEVLYNNSKKLLMIGRNAREQIKNNHTPEHICSQLYNYYSRLTNIE